MLFAAAGGAYCFVLAPKPAKAAQAKIHGTLFPLSPEFVVNLSRRTLRQGHRRAAARDGAAAGARRRLAGDAARGLRPSAPIITNDLTGPPDSDLIERAKRRSTCSNEILRDLSATTDEPVKEVLFTDVVVQ